MKKALVYGAGGFIGSHMVKHLKGKGYYVRGIDLKYPEFSTSKADEFIRGDLRDINFVRNTLIFKGDEVDFYAKVNHKDTDIFDEIYSNDRPGFIDGYKKLKKSITAW